MIDKCGDLFCWAINKRFLIKKRVKNVLIRFSLIRIWVIVCLYFVHYLYYIVLKICETSKCNQFQWNFMWNYTENRLLPMPMALNSETIAVIYLRHRLSECILCVAVWCYAYTKYSISVTIHTHTHTLTHVYLKRTTISRAVSMNK